VAERKGKLGRLRSAVFGVEPRGSMDTASDDASRRRSSTGSRIGAMMAGVGAGPESSGLVQRHRGSSYQGNSGGAASSEKLVPENFSPKVEKGGEGVLEPLLRVEERMRRCLGRRLCNVAYLVLALVVAYILFAIAFDITHWEDPCDVARRSLGLVQNLGDRGQAPYKNPGWKPEIPKIIHQQWKSTEITNERYSKWHDRWKNLFPEPEYQHILWTDETQRELIEKHFPWFLKYYDGYKFNIQRADSVRYFILYFYGGLYADLDYEPLSNFWIHLPQDRVSLIESPYQYNEYVQNSLMSSPKADLFWNHSFKILMEQFGKPVLTATGPVFLDITIKTNAEPFYALPCENFHRIPLGEQDQSPFLTLLHREVLGRIFPMKQCGSYKDLTCQLGRHHNTASYLKDTGLFNLLWT